MQFISFHIYSFLCQGEVPRNIWYTRKTFVYKVWRQQANNRRKTGKSSIVNANSTNLTCQVYEKILSVKNHLLLISINFCWRPPNWSKLSNSRFFDAGFSKKGFIECQEYIYVTQRKLYVTNYKGLFLELV